MKPAATLKKLAISKLTARSLLPPASSQCVLMLAAALAALLLTLSYSLVPRISRANAPPSEARHGPSTENLQGLTALQHIESLFPEEVATMVRRKAAEDQMSYPQDPDEVDQATIALQRILERRRKVYSFPMEDPIPKDIPKSSVSTADARNALSKAASEGEDPEMLKGLASMLEPDPNDPHREARQEKRHQRQIKRAQHLLALHKAAEKLSEEELRDSEGALKSVVDSWADGSLNTGQEPQGQAGGASTKPAAFVMFKEGQDQMVRLIKDQLIMARAYNAIATQSGNARLAKEIKGRIKELTKALGEAETDTDLPKNAVDKMRAMGQVLAKAKEKHYDCTSLVKKLRAMVHATEDQNEALRRQGLFLSQLAARTVPKGLFCLSMRLTVEYWSMTPEQQQLPGKDRLEDRRLHHYALFSDNVLASAVVVNSTITNCKNSSEHVIHIVTDKLMFGAMKAWFLLNPPGDAAIEVMNIDEFTWLNATYCPVLKQLQTASMREFYFKLQQEGKGAKGGSGGNDDASNLKYRNPKYLNMLNHLRFYLPEVYPKLDKILFLDDDIVVQGDLTHLWKEDLKGMVNGAVMTCGTSFHRFDKYLNFSNPLIATSFDPQACGWAYGMNMFDLDQWKVKDITGIYHHWQTLNEERTLWKLGTLPPGLITFYNLTHALPKQSHFLGLGYNPNLDMQELERAAVIHWNGNMKPWLEIGMSKFKGYWTKYVDYNSPFLQLCNINP